MKKVLLVLLMMLLWTSPNATSAEETNAVLVNDTTMVPMRDLFESIGADVTWNQKLKRASATLDETRLDLNIDSRFAVKDGELIQMIQAPVLIKGKTYLPLRFVTENFGAEVEWNQETRTAHVFLNEKHLSYPIGDVVKLMDDYTLDDSMIYEYTNDYFTHIASSQGNGYWYFYSQDGEMQTYQYLMKNQLLIFGIPQSDILSYDLKYPIKVGQKWEQPAAYDEQSIQYEITDILDQYETKNGTYNHVVEVTGEDFKFYYAKDIGMVESKRISDGMIVSYIKSIKKHPEHVVIESSHYLPEEGYVYTYKNYEGKTGAAHAKREESERGVAYYYQDLYHEHQFYLDTLLTKSSDGYGFHYGVELDHPLQKGDRVETTYNYGGLEPEFHDIQKGYVEVVSTDEKVNAAGMEFDEVVVVKNTIPDGYPPHFSFADAYFLPEEYLSSNEPNAVYTYFAKGYGMIKSELEFDSGKLMTLYELTDVKTFFE
ncbi:copper amine oxidase N-terminal domain-containing protein [Filobacillus milosensis]|nr:copper amine oxidase N-terminal domain-containing protein [Filobacillus milosensis]